jgi:transposase-like protein
MSKSTTCPSCNSHNVDQFVNDEQLWHCHTCSEMWESDDDIEYVFTNLTITEYPDPMEGVNI